MVPNTQASQEQSAMPHIQFSLQLRLSRISLAVAAAKTSSVSPKAQSAVFLPFRRPPVRRLHREGPYKIWRTSIAITVRAETHSDIPALKSAVITNWLAPA